MALRQEHFSTLAHALQNKIGGVMNRTISLIGAIFMLLAIAVAAKTVADKSNEPIKAVAADAENPRAEDETTARDPWEYLVVAGGNSSNLSASGSSSMRKEPKIQAFRENFVLEQNMDKLGAHGWELVSVTGLPTDPIYYFKRRKEK
jgi:hypothetical protein